jgi:hypothetical protein
VKGGFSVEFALSRHCDMNRDSLHPETRKLSRQFRSPQRITITMPYGAYQRLLERSDQEGRSLSNLAAFLLESAVGSMDDPSMHFK